MNTDTLKELEALCGRYSDMDECHLFIDLVREILSRAKQEESQKPTAPESLCKKMSVWANKRIIEHHGIGERREGYRQAQVAVEQILSAYRPEKPTADKGLLTELYAYTKKHHEFLWDEVYAIMNRYAPAEQPQEQGLVLAEGEFHSTDDWQLWFHPKGRPETTCNIESTRLHGRHGKLIFVESSPASSVKEEHATDMDKGTNKKI